MPLDHPHSEIAYISLFYKIKAWELILLSLVFPLCYLYYLWLSWKPSSPWGQLLTSFSITTAFIVPLFHMHPVKTCRWMSYQGVSLGINLQGLYSIIIACIHILILHAQPDVLGSDLSLGKKKKGGGGVLLCICSVGTKKKVSWSFLWRSWHPGRSPTNTPCLPHSYICKPYHVYSAVLEMFREKKKNEDLVWKMIFIQVAGVFQLEGNTLSGRKYWMGLSTLQFLTLCICEQPSIKDMQFKSAEESPPSPAVIFLQRHNLRTFGYLHFCMCLKAFVSMTMMASGYDLLTVPADNQVSKIPEFIYALWFFLLFSGSTKKPLVAPTTVVFSMKQQIIETSKYSL